MTKRNDPCWVCGQPTMVKDTAEERTLYPSHRREIMCKSCKQKQVDALVIKTRKELGLP